MSGLFAGLTGLDVIYYQDSYPEENKKSKTLNFLTDVGGPAANAAVTYSLLGGEAVLATCIGSDSTGRMIRDLLENRYGVRVLDFAEEGESACISSIIVNTATGSRTIFSGQHSYRCGKMLSREEICEAEFCFFDTNLPELCLSAVRDAHELGKQVILDCGSWKPHTAEFLKNADTAIASVDCHPESGEDFLSAARRYGVSDAAVTGGEAEIIWQRTRSGESGSILPPRVRAVDTLGAGDVFHGAFCYYRKTGGSFPEALRAASETAAQSVRFRGAREGVLAAVRNMNPYTETPAPKTD